MTRNRWTILGTLALARASMAYQMQTVGSVSAYIAGDLRVDYTGLGMLIGLYMLPGVVLALPGGMLGMRFGDARVCTAGLALMALGGVTMGFADSYTVAAAGRALSGVGAVLLNVLLTKMVTEWFAGREIITAMALFVNSWPLGFAVGLMTQPVLAESLGWQAVMHLAAVVCALCLLLVALVYRPPPDAHRLDTAVSSHPLRLGLLPREVALVLLAGIVWATFNVGFILLVSFSPEFLIDVGYSASEAGAIASIATWLALISVPLGGYLAERSGRPDVILVVSLLAFSAAMASISAESSFVVFVILGIVNGIPAGIIMSLPGRAVRPEALGPAMGLYFTCYYVGMAALPGAAGWTRDTFLSGRAPLLFGAATIMLGLLAFIGFLLTENRVRSTDRAER
jgi:predicted MFS family arabinose efflux permease